MYFVVGVKLATDATVKKCRADQRLVAGQAEVNAPGPAAVGPVQVIGGRSVQKESESCTTENIKGERAFAMEYRCVKLRRGFCNR